MMGVQKIRFFLISRIAHRSKNKLQSLRMRKFLSLLALTAMAALPLADAQNATPTPAGNAAAAATPKKRARKAANPSPSPGTAANPAGSPSPTKRTRRGAKASPSPANAPGTAASPSPASGGLLGAFKKKNTTAAPVGTPGGAGTVWVNTETHVYHKQGSRYYGKTKQGKYVSEQDAIKEGDHAAKNGE